MTTTPRLALVEVTRSRPGQERYHAYTQLLNGRVESTATASGWDVVRVGAADVGTDRLLAATDAADAVVIMGGEDVSPSLYGGSTGYPAEGRHSLVADEAQIALVRRTLARGLPYLGVCRGLQILSVALGGTLVQDLGDDTIHKTIGAPVEQLMHRHEVRLDAASRLAAALGSTSVGVQSAHHQAIDTPGAGLRAVGWAPDGVIEAVEHESAPVAAVQWHPEDPGSPADQLDDLLASLAASVREQAASRSRLAA